MPRKYIWKMKTGLIVRQMSVEISNALENILQALLYSLFIILTTLKLKSSFVKCISEKLNQKCLSHLRWCHWLKNQEITGRKSAERNMENSEVTEWTRGVLVEFAPNIPCESEFSAIGVQRIVKINYSAHGLIPQFTAAPSRVAPVTALVKQNVMPIQALCPRAECGWRRMSNLANGSHLDY